MNEWIILQKKIKFKKKTYNCSYVEKENIPSYFNSQLRPENAA